jgi:DNA-binding winged helix-turn-helix (wHTH) protein
MQVTFGNCRLDVTRRLLFRDGEEVRLAPKAFDLLCYLVQERPRAVSKDELTQHIWKGTFVSEDGLHGLMNQIRTAIGDTAREPRCIRTIYGFGYAFEAATEQSLDDEGGAFGACLLTWGTQQFRLREGVHVIGRDATADIALDGSTISRRHARIVVQVGRAAIEDLGSKNGTFVGDERIACARTLRNRDEIRIGDYLLTFHADALTPTETSA